MILLGSIIFIYAYYKELRTSSGKCVSLFVASQLLIHLVSPYLFTNSNESGYRDWLRDLIRIGGVLSVMWINVLCFDIWWTFRKFKSSWDSSHCFKFYCFYVFGLTLAFESTFIFEEVHEWLKLVYFTFFFTFFALGALNVLLLCLTGYNMFKLSKSLSISEHPRFKAEKAR